MLRVWTQAVRPLFERMPPKSGRAQMAPRSTRLSRAEEAEVHMIGSDDEEWFEEEDTEE